MSDRNILLLLRQINICLGLYENKKLVASGMTFFLNDAKNVLNIIALAKKRFEEPVVDERQFFSIGCHSSNELRLLPGVLRRDGKSG